jgi:hypothetical protein
MGVYFTIYLVDEQPFEQLLGSDARSTFRWLSDCANADEDGLHAMLDGERGIGVEWRGRVGQLIGGPTSEGSLRLLLESSDSVALEGLLRCLSRRTDTSYVVTLLTGHRRWWLGGMLREMQMVREFDDTEVQQAAALASKLLRGADCGFEVPADPGLRGLGLPVIPGDDHGHLCGGWAPGEVEVF